MRMLTEHKPTARESLCLAAVCRDTIARVRPLAKIKQVTIRLEIHTGRTKVQGVKELLETALYNFVINSIAALDYPKFTHRCVIVRVAAQDPGRTAIQVVDNGIGVPDAIRDKIFEPFVTSRVDGSGLGLAIAGDIIRWHFGRVSCRPRKSGTTQKSGTSMEMSFPQE